MATFTVSSTTSNDLYADCGVSGPVAGDNVEVTRGYADYTTGLNFSGTNFGDVTVGQGFGGTIGADGNPWLLQSNTAGEMVRLLGGKRIYLSCSTTTIARLIVDMADPNALVVLSGAAAGAMSNIWAWSKNIEIMDSVATLGTVYVPGRATIRGSGSAAAATLFEVQPGGLATIERDVAGITVRGGGEAVLNHERVTPSGTVTVDGVLTCREVGAFGGASALVLNEGGVLDLSRLHTALSLFDLTLGDNCRIIRRQGGPGYSASGTTTTRGRGALVEFVTR